MTNRDFSERDVHMALDGELPGDERAAYEAWLAANPEMKARSSRFAADADALRAALAGVLEEPVPARLARIVTGEAAGRPARPWSRWWLAAAAVLLLAVGGAGGYVAGLDGLGGGNSAENQLAEEAIAAHVLFASEKLHAVEVPASDKEHMEAWLSDSIGIKLVSPDLSGEGFQLMGGRLLPAGEHKAAMLLYQDGKGNRISMFVTAEPVATGKGTYRLADSGPLAVYWLDKGYGCAIVGTLPKAELTTVAKSAYRQLLAGMVS